MKALFADPRMKNEKQNLSILLSESAGNCTPKCRQPFAVTHRLLIKVRIIEPKMKNEKHIVTVYLSESASNCAPEDRQLFAVIH